MRLSLSRDGRMGLVVGTMAIVVITNSALGQEKKAEQPLGGPRVSDGGVPGENRRFSGESGLKRKDMQRNIPHRVFMRSFDSLRGQDVPDSLRLSAEQETKLKEINDGFLADTRSFREANSAETRKLIEQLPREQRVQAMQLLRGPGGPDGDFSARAQRPFLKDSKGKKEGDAGSGGMMDEAGRHDNEANAARDRLREIFESAPKLADVHAKMYGVLSQEQKAAVEKQLAALTSEIEKRRKDTADGLMQEKSDHAGSDKPSGVVRERVRQRVQNLSPEQREEFMRRIQERRAENGPKKKQ